jgi:Fic family protein
MSHKKEEPRSHRIGLELRRHIGLKMKEIRDHPDLYEARKKIVDDALYNLGDVYSFWIEHPELREAYLTHRKQPETMKKEAREGIRCITDGWYFLLDRGREGDFVDIFTAHDLERLNSIVYRYKHRVDKPKPGEQFRKSRVTLNAKGYMPPEPKEVPKLVSSALKRIKRTFYEDALEAGIQAHLELGAIQPFIDGNKRCARLVQNRILLDGGLPPSVIPAGEGRFYLDLFTKTLPAYAAKDVDGQREFYDYCASKVNNALDDILDDLQIKKPEEKSE